MQPKIFPNGGSVSWLPFLRKESPGCPKVCPWGRAHHWRRFLHKSGSNGGLNFGKCIIWQQLFAIHRNVILIERGLVRLYGERMAKTLMPPCGWMNWNFYKKIDAADCFCAYGILCGGLALAALSFAGEKLLRIQQSSSRSSEAQEPVLFLR